MTPEETTPLLTPARKRAIVIAVVAIAAVVVGAVLAFAHGGSASASGNRAGGPPGFGNGTPPSMSGGTGRANGSDDSSFDEFRQCLEDNGVTPPDPSQQSGPPSLDDSTMRKAFEACRQYMPDRGGRFGPPQGQKPSQQPDTRTTTNGTTTT